MPGKQKCEPTEARGTLIEQGIIDWLDKTFKSSVPTSRLFKLGSETQLPDGEMSSHLVVLHQLVQGADVGSFVRCVGLHFCKGERGQEVCSFHTVAYYVGRSALAVIDGRHTYTDDGRKITDFDHHWFQQTEEWKFETAVNRAQSFLELVTNKLGSELPSEHPLAQTTGIKAIIKER